MRHTGHIRQRSEASFEVRYKLSPDPATGKRRTETITVRGTRKDAEKELRKILRALDVGDYVEHHNKTVREYMAQWLEIVRGQVSPRTHERYGEIVNGYICPELGNHKLSKLTPIVIQNTYILWENGGRRDGKKGGLSPRSRLHIHRILKSALKTAVQYQLLVKNPADALKAPKVDRTKMAILTASESAKLLEISKSANLYMSSLIALTTGMRRGEIVALRWKNVDLDKSLIRVVESVEQTKKAIRFKPPKNGKTRVITLPSFAVDELSQLKTKQAEELLRLGIRQDGESFVCGRQDGGVLQPNTLTFYFASFIKSLKDFPKIKFHDLRHTHATQLLMSGIHPKVASERLGHSSISITLDIYSHVLENMQNDAAAKLDSVFRSELSKKHNS